MKKWPSIFLAMGSEHFGNLAISSLAPIVDWHVCDNLQYRHVRKKPDNSYLQILPLINQQQEINPTLPSSSKAVDSDRHQKTIKTIVQDEDMHSQT
jgi:hypothetical protein